MSFWDRFVLWLYLGMADSVPVPRATAGRIFEQALQRGRLKLPALNDLSVLLLLACAAPNSPIGTAALAEALSRNFPARRHDMAALLRDLAPPRLTDLLEVGRAPVPELRGLVAGVLFDRVNSEVLINLCQFLGRLSLTEPESQLSRAVPLLHKALLSYYHIPLGTLDFSSRLYRHVLSGMQPRAQPLPRAWPEGPRPALDPDEFGVLDRGLRRLKPKGRVLLALQLYARLDVEQIAAVWQGANQTWTADRVARALEQCWNAVL